MQRLCWRAGCSCPYLQGLGKLCWGASPCNSHEVGQAKHLQGRSRLLIPASEGSNLEHAGCSKVWQVRSSHQHPALVIPAFLLASTCGTCDSMSCISLAMGCSRGAHPKDAAYPPFTLDAVQHALAHPVCALLCNYPTSRAHKLKQYTGQYALD